MPEFESLNAKVEKPSAGAFAPFFKGEIEEDEWHKAILLEIRPCKKKWKDKEQDAWKWVYELQSKEFAVETDDGIKKAQVHEDTSQKMTMPPRMSRAYERYTQLTGSEPAPGDDIDLKSLFGTVCKVMIKNSKGTNVTFHNIEKISVKGLKQESKTVETPKKKQTERPVETSDFDTDVKEDDDDVISNIFDDD